LLPRLAAAAVAVTVAVAAIAENVAAAAAQDENENNNQTAVAVTEHFIFPFSAQGDDVFILDSRPALGAAAEGALVSHMTRAVTPPSSSV